MGEELKPAHIVFICYASEDSVQANAARGWLERVKIPCWIAPRDVLPGIPYGQAIAEAIDKSRILVLIFSGHANASNHVMRELELAVDGEIPIIPLRIENVKPSKSLVYFLKAIHWLDAFTPPLARHLEDLEKTVRTILAGNSARETRAGRVAVPPPVPVKPAVATVAQGLPSLPRPRPSPLPSVLPARAGKPRPVSIAKPAGMSKMLCLGLAILVIAAAVFAGFWVLQNPPGAFSGGAGGNEAKATHTGKGSPPATWVVAKPPPTAPGAPPGNAVVTVRIFDSLTFLQEKVEVTVDFKGMTKTIRLDLDKTSDHVAFSVDPGRYPISFRCVTYSKVGGELIRIEASGQTTIELNASADYNVVMSEDLSPPVTLSLQPRVALAD